MNTITAVTQQNQDSIILTTGMFDLLKEQIRRKKLTPFNEAKLVAQLRTAQQVIRRDLPENIVDVNTMVRLTDKDTNEVLEIKFVAPNRARRKHQTESILSPIGLALIGYPKGAEVPWEMPDGIKNYKIEEVSSI